MKYDIQSGMKGLIFDLDGTLVNTMPFHYKAWQKTCHILGLKLDLDYLRGQTGNSNRRIAADIISYSGLNGKITVDQVTETKLKEFYKYVHLISPIEPVFAIARKYSGILPMAIGTGGPRKSVDRTIELTGLKKYFDIVISADDVTNHKPHPETFLTCAVLMGIEPQYIEVFEDGDFGIEAAMRAGMKVTDVRSWYKSDYYT
jgi:beta-phosphoglucomutase-like phosphatase (HAD superfamily)